MRHLFRKPLIWVTGSSLILTLIASYFVIRWMLPETMTMSKFEGGSFSPVQVTSMGVFYAIMIGLVVGAAIFVNNRILYRAG